MNAAPDSTWAIDAYRQAKWAEGYERQAFAEALSQLYLKSSTMKQDTQECCDFITADIGGWRWGSRIRRYSSFNRRDLTIRCQTKGRRKTEIDKIHQTDMYLFAWIDDLGKRSELDAWAVVDIRMLRKAIDLRSLPVRSNGDGTAFHYMPIMPHWRYDVEFSVYACAALVGGQHGVGKAITHTYLPDRVKTDPLLTQGKLF